MKSTLITKQKEARAADMKIACNVEDQLLKKKFQTYDKIL